MRHLVANLCIDTCSLFLLPIASHIKRVRVPSQASDVDQFLDDLFSPVLDGQPMDDGLSDAKSLAASMRGEC